MINSLSTVKNLVELLSLFFVLDNSDNFAKRARDLILIVKKSFPI
jgi:hypothetical protein